MIAQDLRRSPALWDAAAKVLADSQQPMTTKEIVESIAAKSYWKSPEGETPDLTLCTAIVRGIL